MASLLSERLSALLPTSGKLASAARAAVVAAQSPPPSWLSWAEEGVSLEPGAPLVVVATAGTDLLALDLCAEAIERARIPVLGSSDGRWWRPVAADLGTLAGCPPGGEELGALSFDRAAKRAPTWFHLHAAEAERARAEGRTNDEAARVVAALRRPLRTADGLEEIVAVQGRALALETVTSVDPLTLRLARAGLDAEAWRTVGAERAVAGRTGDALRALDGALFLGAPLVAVRPAYERLLIRANWAWARPLLDG